MSGRLNYTTHAIEVIRRTARTAVLSKRDEMAMHGVVSNLRKAQKFMLPDRGELIFHRGDMPSEVEVHRLPFPVTVVEFPFSYAENEINHDIEQPSTRRIGMAVEGDLFTDEGGEVRFTPRPGGDGFSVQVVSYVDHHRFWHLMPAQAYVPYGTKTGPSNTDDSPYSKVATRSATPFALVRLLPDQFIAAHDDPKLGIAALRNDVAREVNLITEFLSVISCSNVSTEVQAAPRVLNKARRNKKKEPFFDYHVLVIDGTTGVPSQQDSAPSDGDPKVRTHLRRGHIRRLQSGRRIWVNATIVAPGSKIGAVDKEYRVKPPVNAGNA